MGTGLAYLADANITSTTFGQTAGPVTTPNPPYGARQMYLRGEFRF